MAPPARYCVPGERLCSTEEATAGSGTYTRHGFIFSSLAGCLEKRSEDSGVCSINSRFAKVHILYVGSTPLKSTFRGTIRREDIRATEKDKVEVYKSFRPGDIVLAKVISLGDAQSNYLLSTAENELGVVVARSEAGRDGPRAPGWDGSASLLPKGQLVWPPPFPHGGTQFREGKPLTWCS
ncbi:exosome complex component CSL4 isoform 5-T5 [Morphnus guianensis]